MQQKHKKPTQPPLLDEHAGDDEIPDRGVPSTAFHVRVNQVVLRLLNKALC
jgi:hypothetical protein